MGDVHFGLGYILSWTRKLAIFQALVEAKLLYSLSSICLTTAQQRQLNGFQNRNLRKIIGISPSFESRVSNTAVLRRCGCKPATVLLLKRQLALLGKIMRTAEGHPLRVASFIPGSNTAITERYVRRRGRPAKEWIRTMMDEAANLCGSRNAAEVAMTCSTGWGLILNALQ